MRDKVLFAIGAALLLLALAGAAELLTRAAPREVTTADLPALALTNPALDVSGSFQRINSSGTSPLPASALVIAAGLLAALSWGLRAWIRAPLQAAASGSITLAQGLAQQQGRQRALRVAAGTIAALAGASTLAFIALLYLQPRGGTSSSWPTATVLAGQTATQALIIDIQTRTAMAQLTTTAGALPPSATTELAPTAITTGTATQEAAGTATALAATATANASGDEPTETPTVSTPTPTGGPTETSTISTPTPARDARIEAEWPQEFEIGRADVVRVALVFTDPGAAATPSPTAEQSPTPTGVATIVSPITPERLASPTPVVGGPAVEYEACVTAELTGEGVIALPRGGGCMPLDQQRVVWEWDVTAQQTGRRDLHVVVNVEWRPIGGGETVSRTIWDAELVTRAVAYRIPTRQLTPLSLANACLGVVLTAPLAARRIGGARRQGGPPDDTAQPHLNTRFDGIDADEPLPVGTRVPLIVWVGPQVAGTLAQSSRPFAFAFPDDVTPVDFTVHVHADPACWTIKEVEPTMRVAPPGVTQQEAEFLITARRPGSDKLYICVERADTGAAVQHIWLPVVAGERERALGDAHTAEPSAVRLPIDTGALRRRAVQITIQSGRDSGSFEAVINADLPGGRVHQFYSVPVSVQEIQNATLRLRQELEQIVFYAAEENGEVYHPFADLNDLTVDPALARASAVPLADAGQQVWHLLFNAPRAPAGLKETAAAIRDLPHGSSLQIVIESQQFIVPWALLYDTPGPIDAETLDWSGFWGYRYILDVLPPGNYPEPTISGPPSVQLLLSNDEGLRRFTLAQQQFVQAELGAEHAAAAWGTRDVLRLISAGTPAPLVYLYCHGAHASGTIRPGALPSESALSFGAGERVRLADLRRMRGGPLPGRPLVFLNACEGATQEAFYYDGFMPFFIEESGARGFIGTEVKAPQLLAHDFALEFLRRFARGGAVGAILWELRRHYLETHHSILAFNYTLYGLDEVQLARPVRPIAESSTE